MLRRGDADLAVLPEAGPVSADALSSPRMLGAGPRGPQTFGTLSRWTETSPSFHRSSVSRPSLNADSLAVDSTPTQESEEEHARKKALSGPLPKASFYFIQHSSLAW